MVAPDWWPSPPWFTWRSSTTFRQCNNLSRPILDHHEIRIIMASPAIVTLSAQNFEAEVLKSSTPVLVDFWAEWCGPCKQIAPVLNELADEYTGKAKVAKLNIEEGANQQLAINFRVQSIPMFLVFKGGQVVAQHVGIAGGKAKLKSLIEGAVA
jgi:thioredoxin 1